MSTTIFKCEKCDSILDEEDFNASPGQWHCSECDFIDTVNKPESNASSDLATVEKNLSNLDKVKAHVKRHRGKYGIGAGVALGALAVLIYNKSQKEQRSVDESDYDYDYDHGNGDVYDYDYDYDYDVSTESLSVYDAADIWASNGKDEDYTFGYTEEELERALRQ